MIALLKWFFGKKSGKNLVVSENGITFAVAFANGRMDEWFSHRSAKPGTAVRVRLRPQDLKALTPLESAPICLI